MRRLLLATALLTTSAAEFSQTTAYRDEAIQTQLKEVQAMKPRFGIKAGYNVAHLYGSAANFSPDAKNGFTVAAFYSPGAKSGLGYRTEIVFSRQGFEFAEGGKKSGVTNDYLYMPHFTTFGIGKFLQFQLGGQLGYLLKSSKQSGSQSDNITSFAERLDYGAAGGLEIYPHKHLIIGGRYNISFGNAYKRLQEQSTQTPMPFPLPFNPNEVKGKNGVINLFVGIRF